MHRRDRSFKKNFFCSAVEVNAPRNGDSAKLRKSKTSDSGALSMEVPKKADETTSSLPASKTIPNGNIAMMGLIPPPPLNSNNLVSQNLSLFHISLSAL